MTVRRRSVVLGLPLAAGILSGNYPSFANPEALRDPAGRRTIAEHLDLLARAFPWIDGHQAEYAVAQAPVVGIPEASLCALLANQSQRRRLARPDDAAVASHQQVADVFFRAGLLPRRVDVAPLWDRSLELEVA